MSWAGWAQSELDTLRSMDRLRRVAAFDACGVEGIVQGRRVVSFATNDYLGLAFHPQVRRAAHDAIERFGAGSGSSRLILGTRPLHDELEVALANWKGTQRALVFPSGFAANLGVLSALGVQGATIFSDALNHASIIDGCRLAKARTVIYRHADAAHLEALLKTVAGPKIVVSDSVFSMDGDVAPIDDLARLCIRYGALLVLDEAHAVVGPDIASQDRLELLRVGTLSKTFGSLGGWVAGPQALIELLINRARSFIYTTGLSPADAAAALAALSVYRSAEGEQLRVRLRDVTNRIRPQHPSPIVPILLGEDRAALAAAEKLLVSGIYIPAIRPPTVPAGTARLRITLSAAHTDAMVTRLERALADITGGTGERSWDLS